MAWIKKIRVANGVFWVEIPAADIFCLCGCPADSVKYLMKRGLIVSTERNSIAFETGPNTILLSDTLLQNSNFSNLAEFPVLQMLYRQGMILPNHPNNNGNKPMIMGMKEQVNAQLHYIYRGNYGLVNRAEIEACEIQPELCEEMLLMKLGFAFGKIRQTKELLDTLEIGKDPVEIKNGVYIRRKKMNLYEFAFRGEKVEVDLNLAPGENYELPYPLSFHQIKREYFAVIHAGDGDGWDINRPSMSSLLMFQGKIYLIDAGPNITYSLNALGIGVNEIEGIFHTHCHDDHFAGLTTLIRSDRKLKYYATTLVRNSVSKKLSALLSMDETCFHDYFEVHDLEFDIWNQIDSLEVRPLWSPHPVETNIFQFRTLWAEGYKTYAHYADIASMPILKNMIREPGAQKPGILLDRLEKVQKDYLWRADLKKIDAGGGLIHGSAEDFRSDASPKIILSHSALPFTNEQKQIGAGAPFGTVDVLIPTTQNYEWRYAHDYLQAYFPDIAIHQMRILLNNTVEVFNPESILIKRGEKHNEIYLVLTGNVEIIDPDVNIQRTLSAGAFIGEVSGIQGCESRETFRATSFVRALKIPSTLFMEFVRQNRLEREIHSLQEIRDFLHRTNLFGEAISYPIQRKIAQSITISCYDSADSLSLKGLDSLHLVLSGKVERYLDNDVFEIIEPGNFYGEETAIFDTPPLYELRSAENTILYSIPGNLLRQIPVVKLKLLETWEKRTLLVANTTLSSKPVFFWRDEYCVHIQSMDFQHKKLFDFANTLSKAMELGADLTSILSIFDEMIEFSTTHFNEEEQLMKTHHYPELEIHRKKHLKMTEKALGFQKRFHTRKKVDSDEFLQFLKDWVINHVLTEDRKYSLFFNQRGVF